MKRILVILMVLMVVPMAAHAAKVLKSLNNQTMTPIGGADSLSNAQILHVNADGSINVVFGAAPGSEIHTGIVNIPDSGATDRTQMPDIEASNCTIQAFTSNIGSVYVGDATVTNKDGAKRGLELAPGMPYNDVAVVNLNLLYVASDTDDNKVAYLCN